MARKSKKTSLPPPFLKRVRVSVPEELRGEFPYSIPLLKDGRAEFEIVSPVCVISGANGIGKSSIIEAIAEQAGFSTGGGTQNYSHISNDESDLSQYLRLSWLPKMRSGFFFRAETFFNFSHAVDRVASESGSDLYEAYGGRSLLERSHGESFISLFKSRMNNQGIYLLDEPEAALSPKRLIELLKIIRIVEEGGMGQLIIVTHSPLIMAYPTAQFLYFEIGKVEERDYRETEHFQLLKDFFDHPEEFIAQAIS